MSENQVEAYFIEKDTIARALGSKDKALLKKVLKDSSGIIKATRNRFETKTTLAKGIEAFIDGTPDLGNDFLCGFSAWAILAALSDERPEDPVIEPPGLWPEEAIALWKKNRAYPVFSELLKAIDGQKTKRFQLPLPEAKATLPRFAFVDRSELAEVEPDAMAFFNLCAPLFADGLTGNVDVDSNYDILLVAVWLQEARERNRSLLVVVDGDL